MGHSHIEIETIEALEKLFDAGYRPIIQDGHNLLALKQPGVHRRKDVFIDVMQDFFHKSKVHRDCAIELLLENRWVPEKQQEMLF